MIFDASRFSCWQIAGKVKASLYLYYTISSIHHSYSCFYILLQLLRYSLLHLNQSARITTLVSFERRGQLGAQTLNKPQRVDAILPSPCPHHHSPLFLRRTPRSLMRSSFRNRPSPYERPMDEDENLHHPQTMPVHPSLPCSPLLARPLDLPALYNNHHLKLY